MSPRVIGSGPVLVTATVQTTLPPAFTVADETVFEIDRVYRQGSQSMATEPMAPAPATMGDAVPATPEMAVGAGAATVGDVAATQLEPPPPPAPVTVWLTVEAPPPPPV